MAAEQPSDIASLAEAARAERLAAGAVVDVFVSRTRAPPDIFASSSRVFGTCCSSADDCYKRLLAEIVAKIVYEASNQYPDIVVVNVQDTEALKFTIARAAMMPEGSSELVVEEYRALTARPKGGWEHFTL